MTSITFLKGMTAGIIVGAAVTMICDPVTDRQRRRMQKKTHYAMRNFGDMVDTAVSKMF